MLSASYLNGISSFCLCWRLRLLNSFLQRADSPPKMLVVRVAEPPTRLYAALRQVLPPARGCMGIVTV